MKLKKITVENYKSIELIRFDVEPIGESFTYSLLGINESGKSSFLNGLSLIDKPNLTYPIDYFDESKPITLRLNYLISPEELIEVKETLELEYGFPKEILDRIVIQNVEIIIQYSNAPEAKRSIDEIIQFKENVFSEYKIIDNVISKRDKNDEALPLNLNLFFKEKKNDYFYRISHRVVFWKSSPEYLLLDEVDLLAFSMTPEKTSIPLLNCFILAGISETNISKEVAKLTSPVSISSLQSKLSELITKHINIVWPDHPISVKFQINNNKISLLIEDNGVKWKPKTTGQRSDGFKQFISFLLTVSVENYNEELTNTILLIDEPETHLHPPAQINLLNELIKITCNGNNNILFFATHSNYLIDKQSLDRNFKVSKIANQRTVIEQIPKKSSSYAEVNYEVFNITTTDYHNELYGYIEFRDKELLAKLPKKRKWIDSRNNKEKDVSLSEYIRHSIHHPENLLNKIYSEKELRESIKSLRDLKENIDSEVMKKNVEQV